MKRFRVLIFLSLIAVMAFSISPARNAFASSAQESVTASAVVVPAQVSQLGFLTSALVKEVTVKEGDTAQAGQTLIVLDTPDLQFAVTVAEEALRSAQANAEIQRYKRVKDRRHGRVFFDVVPPEVRQQADAQVQRAQAALDIAKATLAQATLTAPYTGTIASLNIVPGELVQLDQVVVTLATLNDLQIETTDLSERDIAKVSVGDSANIFMEALNANVRGKVIGISPIADSVGGDVVFKVTIALDEQPAGLLWGMTAEVTIAGK